MIASLIGEQMSHIAPRFDDISEALELADPLVSFSIRAACPECALEQAWIVDLCQYALRGLQGARGQLLRTVHYMARAYHWSEERILELPPSRRNEYMQLISREREAVS